MGSFHPDLKCQDGEFSSMWEPFLQLGKTQVSPRGTKGHALLCCHPLKQSVVISQNYRPGQCHNRKGPRPCTLPPSLEWGNGADSEPPFQIHLLASLHPNVVLPKARSRSSSVYTLSTLLSLSSSAEIHLHSDDTRVHTLSLLWEPRTHPALAVSSASPPGCLTGNSK